MAQFAAIWSAGTPNELKEGLGERAALALAEVSKEGSFGRGMTPARRVRRLAELLNDSIESVEALFRWWAEQGVLLETEGGRRVVTSLEEITNTRLAEQARQRVEALHGASVGGGRGVERSWIPIPRRLIGELCGARRARGKVATVVAHLYAHLYVRGHVEGKWEFNPGGLCTSTWIERAFGICARTVHRARKWLADKLGWLERLGGAAFRVVLSWNSPAATARAKTPQVSVNSPEMAGKCQPQYQKTSSTKNYNQKTLSGRFSNSRKKTPESELDNIDAAQLKDEDYVWKVGEEAIKRGWMPDNLCSWVNLYTTVREILRATKARSKGACLRWRIQKARWFGTENDQAAVEPMVRKRLGYGVTEAEDQVGAMMRVRRKEAISADAKLLLELERRINRGQLRTTVLDLPDVLKRERQWLKERYHDAAAEIAAWRRGELAWE